MPLLSAIAAFVAKRPWIAALAALLLLSGYLSIRLRIATGKLDKATADLAVLKSQVQLQNQAIEDWKEAASEQAARAQTAELAAARIRADRQARIARILTEPIPPQCDNAVRWGAQKGIELGKSWEAGR